MNRKTLAITLVLLVLVVALSGCVGQDAKKDEIKSEEDAAKVVSNISQDVKEVSSVLEEIDNTLK